MLEHLSSCSCMDSSCNRCNKDIFMHHRVIEGLPSWHHFCRNIRVVIAPMKLISVNVTMVLSFNFPFIMELSWYNRHNHHHHNCIVPPPPIMRFSPPPPSSPQFYCFNQHHHHHHLSQGVQRGYRRGIKGAREE